MSSIINKVKDALHHDHSTTSGTTNTATGTTTTGNNSGVPEGVAGPHSSRVANAADPRIDSDMDHRGNANSGLTGTTGTTHNHGTSGLTGTTGTAGTGYGSSNVPEGTAGPHSSRLANTVDPRVDSDRDHRANPNSGVTGTTGTTHNHGTSGLTGTSTTGNNSGVPEGVAGPHSSRVANAVDPRVDSDVDHRANPNSGFTGTTGTTHNHGTSGTSGLTGTTGNSGLTGNEYNSTSQPQHSSNLANKLDPRVDSTTTYGSGNTSGFTGTTGTTTGLTGSEYGTATSQPQHSSNLANKIDPRVDSSTTYGAGQTNTASTLGGTGDRGGLSNSTNAGPHNSNIANKVDPRVDSDLDSTGNRHGASHGGILGSGSHATAGSGTAQNTQGPHNSDLLNKLDPRVDADGDGSRTYGGNKTHA